MQIITKGGTCRVKLTKSEQRKLASAHELLGHLARNLQGQLGDSATKAQESLGATIEGVARLDGQLELPLET